MGRRLKREKQRENRGVPWKRREWRWEESLAAQEEWRRRKREKRKGKVKNCITAECD